MIATIKKPAQLYQPVLLQQAETQVCDGKVVAKLTAVSKMEATDFEGAVTFQIAKRKGVDYIITRDKKGFTDQAVKTVSPEEFLKIIS